MNPRTKRHMVAGAAGAIEVVLDEPAQVSRGVAVIAHPHPLFGGTMDNKVVQTLARAFVQSGWSALRFNFRGVGASGGTHDEGRGETEDMLHIIRSEVADAPLALAGFSFGAFVVTKALSGLGNRQAPDKIVLVGTAVSRFAADPIAPDLHSRTLVVHGESDDTVALSAVMDWARPQTLPVLVVPAGGHFFHGQLPLLKDLVVRHIAA